ncbi:hypothetical protein [Kribbella sp. NPDC000426]|uniref:hypothetical protein n=1 Tax=Kribbella sp. NPDC000426 TaxID=3154255 RepID=UPI0033277F02
MTGLLATLVACGSSKDSAGTPQTSTTAASPSASPIISPSQQPPTPVPPIPPAKDGQNYKACVDGTCEVMIRTKAVLNLNGDKFTATVAKGTLKLTDSHGYISLSQNGTDVSRSGGGTAGGVAGGIAAVSWSDQGGPQHTATLTYAEGDIVVAAFTTTK